MVDGSNRLEAGDQSYFLQGWQTYRKVRDLDYIFLREVYAALHRALTEDAPRPFRFLDVGCGDSVATVGALRGTEVGRYVGIDLSRALLDLAEAEVAGLDCPIALVEGDYRSALADWPDAVDVVWIGQSLHHMNSDEKLPVMRQVRCILAPGGLFLIWEPTSLPGEDRTGWMIRAEAYIATWSGLDTDERRIVVEHGWASDHPEAAARWLELGQRAGFARGQALLEAPPGLCQVFCFHA